MCILRGFPKTRIFVLSIIRRRHLHEMGRIAGFAEAVEMTLRGAGGGIFTRSCGSSHEAWKPAPNAGFHIPTATTITVPGQPERIKEIVGGGLRRTRHRHKSKQQNRYAFHKKLRKSSTPARNRGIPPLRLRPEKARKNVPLVSIAPLAARNYSVARTAAHGAKSALSCSRRTHLMTHRY
jgi:hypothetical protein